MKKRTGGARSDIRIIGTAYKGLRNKVKNSVPIAKLRDVVARWHARIVGLKEDAHEPELMLLAFVSGKAYEVDGNGEKKEVSE